MGGMGLHLERMLAGEWYNPAKDPDLTDAYMECQRELARFNATGVEEDALRAEILRGLWGEFGEGSVVRAATGVRVWVQYPCGAGLFCEF